VLSKVFQQVINRHEVLRTVFLQENDQVYQFILEKDSWNLDLQDGSKYIETADNQELQIYIEKLIVAPFDLGKDHMVRATLLALSCEDYLLVITMHHIASDAWSMSIIVNEVVELYSAYMEDRASNLIPLDLQYSDYSIWQRNYLQDEILNSKLEYWKAKLDGVATLVLPADYTRPSVQSTRGASIDFHIDKELSAKIQLLCQQQGTTTFMTLLAAFKVLLYRYSGQNDISVGTSIASRQQQELEGLIGFFVNTLALRTEVLSDMSFADLLQHVRATTVEAYANHEAPFEKVVDAVVKDRDMSRSPLFQVMLVFQNTPEIPELRFGDIQLSREIFEHNTSKFEITFFVKETKDGLQGSVEYRTDLFSDQKIRGMIAHFRNY
jgi:NRPS condensation-like uncharacterized protein